MSTPPMIGSPPGSSRNGWTFRVGGVRVDIPPLRQLAVPLLMVLILAMMLVPLPPFLLDVLFTFNIALALVVLLVSSYTVRPLDFAVFPSVLLMTTLMRLSLNVASTRAVLMHGHTGTDVAGKVIESFANFVIGGSFAVGIIVFAILTVINFAVVTKGAGRIAEVSARFALDAMPGKQMAIDADLNAGLIDQAEAKRRRAEVSHEADFFGSMDGASKFVRGDAIAGILILLINVIGGLVIGVVQHGMAVGAAAQNDVLLAIGDALVAQVPSLVISVAAGLIVSRVGGDDDVGTALFRQLFSVPRALALAGVVIGILGIVPGMPHIAFLGLAAACGYLAWRVAEQQRRQAEQPVQAEVVEASSDASWDDVSPVDQLSLEVGYRLIALVDRAQGGDLLMRIKGVRKKFAQEVGFLPPAVHIRDDLELRPTAYRVSLKGVVIGEGEVFPGMMLAINPASGLPALPGTPTTDPAFGLPAVWIEQRHREHAQASGYTVVDPATVIATHSHHLMQVNASRLLGRNEAQQLLDHLARFAPKLAEDVVPKLISLSVFQRVLQNLLDESVHIRDLRGIVEVLAEHAVRTQDPTELTREARIGLAPAIVQQIYGFVRELDVIAIEPRLESVLMQGLAPGATSPIEPGVADFVARAAAQAATQQEETGVPSVMLVPDRIRVPVARLVRKGAPRLRVLGHAEIPENLSIRIDRVIGEQR
ncbi:MAG: flagellar biosynthesis protein FlhA [Burkholderiaceae bacterium]